ncbi:MAG: hypothetical protein GXC94_15350 [Comamonadaceae bacterium]|nr:hypothetical protein [Comamonadaceae bacterium]
MAEFFRTSAIWIVDYRFDGRPRRWWRAAPVGNDPSAALAAELAALYGSRAQLEQVRLATAEEEQAYVRGETAPNLYCPLARSEAKR